MGQETSKEQPKKQYPKRKRPMRRPAVVKRHTHSTIAGLEDLTAVLVDIHFTLRRMNTFLKAVEQEIESIQSRASVATDLANVLRIGPNAYPTDGSIRVRSIPRGKKRERTTQNQ